MFRLLLRCILSFVLLSLWSCIEAQVFKSASTGTVISDEDVTAALPSGTQEGDFLLAFVTKQLTTSISTPTGWTELDQLISTNHTAAVFYKFAANTEPGSYTFNTGCCVDEAAIILRYSGVNTALPISAFSVNASSGSSSGANVSAASTDSKLIRFSAFDDGQTGTSPSGHNLRAAASSRSGSAGIGIIASDRSITSTGSQGNEPYTYSISDNWIAYSLILTVADEICNNGIDDDGDGLFDCTDPDCNGSAVCPDYDGDGITDEIDFDDDQDGIIDDVECGFFQNVHDGAYASSEVSFNISSANLNDQMEEHILNSIELNGIVYDNFRAPYAYTSSFNITNVNQVTKRTNNIVTADLFTTMGYDSEVISSFTSNNLNDYQDLNSYDFSDDHYFIEFAEPIHVNSNVIIGITERNMNNPYVIQAYDESSSLIGSLNVDPSDYIDTGADALFSQAIGMAVYNLDDMAAAGNFIKSLRISFGAAATLDGPDGKIFVFTADEDVFCLDADNDGISNKADLDADNDGIFDALESGSGQTHTNGELTGSVDQWGIANSVSNGMGGVNYTLLNTDADLYEDFIDWDSDADGCSDTFESGFVDSDNDLQIDGSGINANGTVAGSTGYANPTESNSGTYDFQDSSLQSGCIDTDSDLITNFNDLDDDNDGIRDSDEITCISEDIGGIWYHNAGTSGQTSLNDIISSVGNESYGSGISTATITSTLLQLTGIESTNLIQAIASDEYVEYSVNTTTSPSADYYVSQFRHYHHPQNSLTDMNFQYAIFASDDGFLTSTLLSVDETMTENLGYQFTDPSKDYYRLAPSSTYTFRTYFYNLPLTNNGEVTYDDFRIDLCSSVMDIDGDAAENQIDLDADGDACFDIVEAGFTDFNNDGFLGPIPISVDGDGLVQTGTDGYTVPSADFLNAAARSCFEICDNSIDDNGDGRVDEIYPYGIEENLLLWVKADDGFSASNWSDLSKNNRVGTNVNNPISVNSLNFNPGIQFDGTNYTVFNLPELVFEDPFNHLAIFCVYQPSTNSNSLGVYGNQAGGVNNIMVYNGGIGNGSTAGTPIPQLFGNTPHLSSIIYDEEDGVSGIPNSSKVYVNGNLIQSFTFNEDGISAVNENFYLGLSGTNAASQNFIGEILELIIYHDSSGSESINMPDIQRVESYLSLKYGINYSKNYLGSQ